MVNQFYKSAQTESTTFDEETDRPDPSPSDGAEADPDLEPADDHPNANGVFTARKWPVFATQNDASGKQDTPKPTGIDELRKEFDGLIGRYFLLPDGGTVELGAVRKARHLSCFDSCGRVVYLEPEV